MGPYGLEVRAASAQFNFSLGEAILLNYIYEVRDARSATVWPLFPQ